MFDYVRGTLAVKKPARVVVEAGGIGYEVLIPLSTYSRLPERGREVRLLLHHHVREDAVKLYGFATPEERDLFHHLIGISGIGPAVATQILSGSAIERFWDAIALADESYLTQIRGIGKKTAPRLILELSGKLPDRLKKPAAPAEEGGVEPVPSADGVVEDAKSALETLGVRADHAERAIQRALKLLGDGEISVEALVREALRHS